MAWLRKGDNAATHPLIMAIATVKDTDERLMNEAVGFLQRCAEQSAGHMTDGVIDLGTVKLMGGENRWQPLVAACVEAGLLTRKARGKKPTWEIPKDADFIHIRSRAEIEWERQRKRDAANPQLTVPVRIRDGDACRYCGQVVMWAARRGGRRGSYDHREPGKAATYETYVVTCLTCNERRGADPGADDSLPLLPPPRNPYYSKTSLKFFANNGVDVDELTRKRPGTQPDTAEHPPANRATAASTTPDPPGQRATTRPPLRSATLERPGTQPDTAENSASPASPVRAASDDRVWLDPASTTPPPDWVPRDRATPAAATPPDPIANPSTLDDDDGAPEGPPPSPDLQISAGSRRFPVYGAGRDGMGGDGPGQDGSGQGGVADPPGSAVPARSRPPRRRARRSGRGGGT